MDDWNCLEGMGAIAAMDAHLVGYQRAGCTSGRHADRFGDTDFHRDVIDAESAGGTGAFNFRVGGLNELYLSLFPRNDAAFRAFVYGADWRLLDRGMLAANFGEDFGNLCRFRVV